ncbi:helix-turn-helix domain-containing protein [Bifidobacterium sp. 7101]|nr:LysR family transcriptional regulator [Bifidobacterium sp. 7101]
MLRYFLAIVEEGSITGAAEYLSISQPSLSRQIKDREDSQPLPRVF